MHTTTRRAAWILGWILALCGGGAAGADSVPAGAPPNLTVAPPLTREQLETSSRLIALKTEGSSTCQEQAPGLNQASWSGWTVKPLFQASSNINGTPPGRLADFCIYEYQPDQLSEPASKPSPPEGLSSYEKDYVALMRAGTGLDSGTELDSLLWKLQEAHFLAQTGEARLPLTGAFPRVRVAILDTQPTEKCLPGRKSRLGKCLPEKAGNSSHGYTMAYIAHRLVCNDDGRCAATVVPELAMSVVSFKDQTVVRNIQKGGFRGTVSELAVAILGAIAHWDDDVHRGREHADHLVLNLSLGWDGALIGGLDEKEKDTPLAVQAVYAALEYAAWRGVLVVAAAGNSRLGPQPGSGPLLPAAWETRVSPWGPLVYAAGGVQSDGRTLSNARQKGTPSRVAYAEQAVVTTPKPNNQPNNQPNNRTAIYTGTSVSAAVLSSVAAAVWNFRPDLSARELMELIDRSGDDLGRPADFFYPENKGPAPVVHRISLCSALVRACRDGQGACPSPKKLPACKEWDRRPLDLRKRLARLKVNSVLDAAQLTKEMEVSGPCSVARVRFAQEPPKFPCPIEQLHDLSDLPGTAPQPPPDPCPNCLLWNPGGGSSYKLAVSVKETQGHCLKSLDLYLDDTSHHWDFEDNQFCEGSTLTVSGLSPRQKVSSAKVALTEFTFEDKPTKSEVTILQ